MKLRSPKSRKRSPREILGTISAKKAEKLLTDWANLPGSWPLADTDKESLTKFVDAQKRVKIHHASFPRDPVGHLWLRDMLRRVWTCSEPREREWVLFRFRDAYSAMVRREPLTAETRTEEDLAADTSGPRYAPPPITPVEAAAFYLHKNLKRALYCPNPACLTPYFFLKRKGQRHCSTPCADVARRESKRRWWNNNRSKRRK